MTFWRPWYLLALLFCAGCATPSAVVVNQPVLPMRPHGSRRKGEGDLIVYTSLDANETNDSDHPTHTSYRIFDPRGVLVRKVDNRTGTFYQEPMTVALPVGTYRIEAWATNVGMVEVSVVIQERKTTVVDLDEEVLPQNVSPGAPGWVRLPDGQVIGSTAD